LQKEVGAKHNQMQCFLQRYITEKAKPIVVYLLNKKIYKCKYTSLQ